MRAPVYGHAVRDHGPVLSVQPITHDGRIVAIVICGQAIIPDGLSAAELRRVQAMCLYALELSEHGQARAYSDRDADRCAQHALRRS